MQSIFQRSGAVWKSRWPSWAPGPNKPTVSVDVKQHFNSNNMQSVPTCRHNLYMTVIRHNTLYPRQNIIYFALCIVYYTMSTYYIFIHKILVSFFILFFFHFLTTVMGPIVASAYYTYSTQTRTCICGAYLTSEHSSTYKIPVTVPTVQVAGYS